MAPRSRCPQSVSTSGASASGFSPTAGVWFICSEGFRAQDFWLLDLVTKKTRQLTQLHNSAAMRTFDITRDGRSIVFDRLRENSDIVLIDLPQKQRP